MASAKEEKNIVVVTEDGKEFVLTEAELKASTLLFNAYDDLKQDRIPVPSVTGKVFDQIITFIRATCGIPSGQVLPKGKEQVKRILIENRGVVKDILLPAQYLQIDTLCDCLNELIAETFSQDGLVSDIARKTNLKCDLTSEQQMQISQVLSFVK